jgi:hypothetical protein
MRFATALRASTSPAWRMSSRWRSPQRPRSWLVGVVPWSCGVSGVGMDHGVCWCARAAAHATGHTVVCLAALSLSRAHAAVTKFARATGDIAALSATDVRLMALAHTLEVAAHGAAHLLAHPNQVRRGGCAGAGLHAAVCCRSACCMVLPHRTARAQC